MPKKESKFECSRHRIGFFKAGKDTDTNSKNSEEQEGSIRNEPPVVGLIGARGRRVGRRIEKRVVSVVGIIERMERNVMRGLQAIIVSSVRIKDVNFKASNHEENHTEHETNQKPQKRVRRSAFLGQSTESSQHVHQAQPIQSPANPPMPFVQCASMARSPTEVSDNSERYLQKHSEHDQQPHKLMESCEMGIVSQSHMDHDDDERCQGHDEAAYLQYYMRLEPTIKGKRRVSQVPRYCISQVYAEHPTYYHQCSVDTHCCLCVDPSFCFFFVTIMPIHCYFFVIFIFYFIFIFILFLFYFIVIFLFIL